MTRAVVFAYHDVGVRCLKVLLAHGVDVRLVVTHRDSPSERIWFASVAQASREYGLDVIAPDDANSPEVVARVSQCAPDFLSSFYSRQMLGAPLLASAARGAYNMHGSLLPRYRGRAPVNWAVLHGERQTGATLHAMTVKPDDGSIVDQQSVPILPDDTAAEVFAKVTVAAEITLDRCLPALLDGSAEHTAQDPSLASYFGGRKPEDGRIDWNASAASIHNLVRAVAPPYPGAFAAIGSGTLRVLRTIRAGSDRDAPAAPDTVAGPALFVHRGELHARCGDGEVLRIAVAEYDGSGIDAAAFVRLFGDTLQLSANGGARAGASTSPARAAPATPGNPDQ